MPETTPLIKAALNLRGGAGFDVYFCPKCKQECLIDVDNMKIRLSVVPDAKTQSR